MVLPKAEEAEDPEPTEEEKRKAAEAAAAQAFAKEQTSNDPIEKAKKWMSELPSHQATCLSLMRQADKPVQNPKTA